MIIGKKVLELFGNRKHKNNQSVIFIAYGPKVAPRNDYSKDIVKNKQPS